LLLPLSADAPDFRRSSFCGDAGCVEVAALAGDQIAVRDAKDARPDAPVLRFTTTEWNAFLSGVAAGEFAPTTLTLRL
jgi:Domain of unknown function (DUF397)